MTTDKNDKPISYLMPFVGAGIPIVVAGTGNEDYRFIETEQKFLLASPVIQSIYEWDVTAKLQDRVAGESATVQTLREVIEWFAAPPKEPTAQTPPRGSSSSGQPPQEPNFFAKGFAKEGSVLFVFDALFHMQDNSKTGHSNPMLTRMLKLAAPELIKRRQTIVLIGKNMVIPPELEGLAAHVEFPRPNLAYMRKLVRSACSWTVTSVGDRMDESKGIQLSEDDEVEIAMLLRGFRAIEAENVLAMALQQNDRLRIKDPTIPVGFDTEFIRKAKVDTVQQSGALQIVLPRKLDDPYSGFGKVGGAGGIKDWWTSRKILFSEEARAEGIDIPKGGVIFGPGGTGKDNAIEAIAEEVGWTVLYADIGAMKAPLQGQTHRNFREVLSAAEAQAPCFLVFSEFEKMFAGGMSGSAAFDGGTSSEIYATFLNWMQRRTEPVFVWGLTNEIQSVPMPALRSGRFDQIFFMDLPEPWEREEIFAVHLKRSGWDPVEHKLDMAVLAEKTDGYTGAEIRKIVNEAVIYKFRGDGPKPVPLAMTHLLEAIRFTPAISRTYEQAIKDQRKFAEEGQFLRANSVEPRLAKGKKGAKVGASLREEI